jgi:hypothetical protein
MIKKIKQDKSEIKAMVDFYGQQYDEVYLVRDMLANCIIAVECAPANSSAPIVDRSNGRRNIFGYQDLFFTTRLRTDTNEAGQRMVGYESRSGNDTRISDFERGEVPETGGKDVLTGGAAAIRTLNPFERSQLQASVRLKQASAKKKADYESYVDKSGHAVERFETFEIVRMK